MKVFFEIYCKLSNFGQNSDFALFYSCCVTASPHGWVDGWMDGWEGGE